MGKRVVLSLFVFMSLIAVWWTTAEAQQCVQWVYVGSGRNVCAVWSPKGLDLQCVINEPCNDIEGVGTCSCEARATANDSIAFCVNPANLTAPPRRVECTRQLTFNPVVETACQANEDHDNESPTGAAHENPKKEQGCTQRIILKADCADCCAGQGPGGTDLVCADVTPIEMDTQVVAFIGGVGFAAAPAGQTCSPDSPVCAFTQHCSINPKKIPFIPFDVPEEGPLPPLPAPAKFPYQCNLTCAGSSCFGD